MRVKGGGKGIQANIHIPRPASLSKVGNWRSLSSYAKSTFGLPTAKQDDDDDGRLFLLVGSDQFPQCAAASGRSRNHSQGSDDELIYISTFRLEKAGPARCVTICTHRVA